MYWESVHQHNRWNGHLEEFVSFILLNNGLLQTELLFVAGIFFALVGLDIGLNIFLKQKYINLIFKPLSSTFKWEIAKNKSDWKLIKRPFSDLGNGHSRANLANSSTHQNGIFWKCARLADIWQPGLLGLARLANIRQPVLLRLTRLADIRQTILRGLARLVKGKFGNFYANLANLANLASVGQTVLYI
jgi:hypothetical protein